MERAARKEEIACTPVGDVLRIGDEEDSRGTAAAACTARSQHRARIDRQENRRWCGWRNDRAEKNVQEVQ